MLLEPRPSRTNPMINIHHVTKRYGTQTVVKDFSLSVDVPVFGFLGQNGAGKTTLMKMIVGLTSPTSGSVTINGLPSASLAVRERIGFMPENPYFYQRLTGLESLMFYHQLFRHSPRKTTAEYEAVLAKLGIYDARHHLVQTYSKGMKQRLGLAQAMINDPEYIFLDEPLDGLDPLGRQEIKAIIKHLRDSGKKLFFNSHILFDVEELCDAIGIIHAGELIYTGSVANFCQSESLEQRFVNEIQRRRLSTHSTH